MTMTPDDVHVWLGPAAEQTTEQQVDQLVQLAATLGERYPDPDDRDDREAAFSAAAQVVLGDSTLEEVGRALQAARRAEHDAMVALTGALLATSGAERELAARAGVARMTVRTALGRS